MGPEEKNRGKKQKYPNWNGQVRGSAVLPRAFSQPSPPQACSWVPVGSSPCLSPVFECPMQKTGPGCCRSRYYVCPVHFTPVSPIVWRHKMEGNDGIACVWQTALQCQTGPSSGHQEPSQVCGSSPVVPQWDTQDCQTDGNALSGMAIPIFSGTEALRPVDRSASVP